jgi:Peptide N-acetyl-beta-D-glucosaminyl asparaginase amidase A
VDGQPAGLAPVFPWIYTGGMDPFLWRPTPGVQTLDFLPYRLDLTPFAGLLSDGAEHAVSVRVLGANHYFAVAAALLVYRDPQAQSTGGAVASNTLAGATLEPGVTSTLGDRLPLDGDLETRARHSYAIEGYVNTPRGRVRSRVESTLTFANTQHFTPGAAQGDRQVVAQTTHAENVSTTSGAALAARSLHSAFDYALTLDMQRHINEDKSDTRSTHLEQSWATQFTQHEVGRKDYQASLRNARSASDQMTYNPALHMVGAHQEQVSRQEFTFHDSLGDCYRMEVKALEGKVSSVTVGQGCNSKPLRWFVHPDGSPDSFGWRANTGH